jgi:hypothetical protein
MALEVETEGLMEELEVFFLAGLRDLWPNIAMKPGWGLLFTIVVPFRGFGVEGLIFDISDSVSLNEDR